MRQAGSAPVRAALDAVALTFRGSRTDLQRVTAQRFETALVLGFLAVRCIHLAQAAVDLALAGRSYTRPGLALGLAMACAAESVVFAAITVRSRHLARWVLLGDALFGMIGLGVMSLATTSSAGRAGSLNWMLPYTVATAAGLGLVARGRLDSSQPSPSGRFRGPWAAAVVSALTVSYMVSVNLPHRLPDEHAAQVWGNAANYPLFFVAAIMVVGVVRRRLAVIAARNADVTEAAGALAREAQWRAVAVDVFGPVLNLLERVGDLEDGEVPAGVRDEADRLISMIEAVRPLETEPVAGGLGIA